MRNYALIIFLFFVNLGFSQQFLLPYRSGNLWGYSDSRGNIIIEPKYDSVSTSNENQCWDVYKNGLAGVINSKGVELLKPIYSGLRRDPKHSQYHDYYVQLDSLWGYSFMNGTFVIEPRYKELTACEFDYRIDHSQAYNFLVLEDNGTNTHALIDKDEKVVLSGITQIYHVTGHFYQFKVDGNWGMYNTVSHKWGIENHFDTIVRLPVQYNNRMETVEQDYYFYARKSDNLYLINSKLEVVESDQGQLDSILRPLESEKENYPPVTMVEPRISRDAQFKDISTFPIGENDEVKFPVGYGDKIESIRLLRKKGRIGLEIVSYGVDNIEPEYDAIYAFANENRRINHTYFLLEKDSKFGVYDVVDERIVVPVQYDSITKGYYNDILMVYAKDQVGVYLMGRVFRDSRSYFFKPEYDAFLKREFARSADFDYNSHNVYFFEKDGVLCPVSERGVKLFD